MSKIRFDIDVHDNNVVDKIERRIEDGMENAVSQRRPDSLGHQIVRVAKDHIRRHGRVWTTELIESFDIQTAQAGDNLVLRIKNDAGHAAAIDLGATYGDEGPPLHRLIPWVESKMKGYRVRGGQLVVYDNDDGGKTILTDGSGKVRGSSRDLPPDLDVESVTPLTEMDDVGGSSKTISYYVEFEDGTAAFFQEYIDPGDMVGASPGTVRNEAVFTRLAGEEDWRIGPENRAGNIIDPDNDELVRGNFQRWIDDSTDAAIDIEDDFMPADYEPRWTPPEFLEDNEEKLAQITVLDILLGNEDRHMENIRVDPDGNIHAIDNGGNYLSFDDGLENIIRYNSVVLASTKFNRFEDYPGLEAAYESLFERQIDLLEDFLTNHREDIFKHTKLIHGPNSQVTQRMRRLLDHSTEEILDQVREHQQDMLETRRVDTDTYDRLLEDADDLDDIADGVLGDIADDFKDL